MRSDINVLIIEGKIILQRDGVNLVEIEPEDAFDIADKLILSANTVLAHNE